MENQFGQRSQTKNIKSIQIYDIFSNNFRSINNKYKFNSRFIYNTNITALIYNSPNNSRSINDSNYSENFYFKKKEI